MVMAQEGWVKPLAAMPQSERRGQVTAYDYTKVTAPFRARARVCTAWRRLFYFLFYFRASEDYRSVIT